MACCARERPRTPSCAAHRRPGGIGGADGLINEKLGLPAAAGTNTAVLNGKVEIANSELVEESEG